jgi:hypothetical protein
MQVLICFYNMRTLADINNTLMTLQCLTITRGRIELISVNTFALIPNKNTMISYCCLHNYISDQLVIKYLILLF